MRCSQGSQTQHIKHLVAELLVIHKDNGSPTTPASFRVHSEHVLSSGEKFAVCCPLHRPVKVIKLVGP